MTTPTEADKRAAMEIVDAQGDVSRHDPYRRLGTDSISAIIATAMQPEREALRLAKGAVGNAIPRMNELTRTYKRTFGAFVGSAAVDFDEAITQLKSALTAIEKVTG